MSNHSTHAIQIARPRANTKNRAGAMSLTQYAPIAGGIALPLARYVGGSLIRGGIDAAANAAYDRGSRAVGAFLGGKKKKTAAEKHARLMEYVDAINAKNRVPPPPAQVVVRTVTRKNRARPRGAGSLVLSNVPRRQRATPRPRSRRQRRAGARTARPLRSLAMVPQAAASAYAIGQRSGEPLFIERSARTTRIVHRELISSITGSSGFTVASTFALNPGISTTFPWLATQAQGWEQYRFNRLRFCYYTRTATSTPGSMMLVPDYDAADAAPSSEQIASSYRDVVEEVPWTVEFTCELDPQALLEPATRKFIRTGGLAANLDIKTYDGGNLFVCTTDGTAVAWGKLWVEYDVSFFVPQLPPQGAGLQLSAKVSSGAATSKTAYFGTTGVVTGGLAVTAAAMTITFNQQGQYLVVWAITGTGVLVPAVAGTAAVAALENPAGFGVVATDLIGVCTVNCTAVGQTLVFTDGGSTTVTGVNARIAPYQIASA